MNSMKKKYFIVNLLYTAIFILLLAIDRITKKIAVHQIMKHDVDLIPDVLSLHYLENRGAAWGWFQNATWLFVLVTVVVVIAMLYFYSHIPIERKYTLLRLSIIILSAGAVGNFIDRIMWHYVVDFIYIKCINFPVFNIADCYVCVSAVLLLYCFLIKYKDVDFFGKRDRTN